MLFVFRSPHFASRVTEICHVALPTYSLCAVEVRLKSVSNEGHINLGAESLFRPYLPSHCSGVTEICNVALTAPALQAVRVRLKSVNIEGHFPLDAETFFVPVSPRIAVRWLKYTILNPLRMRYKQCKLG
jgi:hypothetical protein